MLTKLSILLVLKVQFGVTTTMNIKGFLLLSLFSFLSFFLLKFILANQTAWAEGYHVHACCRFPSLFCLLSRFNFVISVIFAGQWCLRIFSGDKMYIFEYRQYVSMLPYESSVILGGYRLPFFLVLRPGDKEVRGFAQVYALRKDSIRN